MPFPYVEIHLTNIDKRSIRSILAETAVGVIAGFGVRSYVLGLEAMLGHLGATARPRPGSARKRSGPRSGR